MGGEGKGGRECGPSPLPVLASVTLPSLNWQKGEEKRKEEEEKGEVKLRGTKGKSIYRPPLY